MAYKLSTEEVGRNGFVCIEYEDVCPAWVGGWNTPHRRYRCLFSGQRDVLEGLLSCCPFFNRKTVVIIKTSHLIEEGYANESSTL